MREPPPAHHSHVPDLTVNQGLQGVFTDFCMSEFSRVFEQYPADVNGNVPIPYYHYISLIAKIQLISLVPGVVIIPVYHVSCVQDCFIMSGCLLPFREPRWLIILLRAYCIYHSTVLFSKFTQRLLSYFLVSVVLEASV